MSSCLLSLLFLASLATSLAVRIQPNELTSSENAQLQRTCGLESYYHTKVLNGEGPQDYPWAASVNIKGVLTASVISPRHILLFNVFEYNYGTQKVTIFNETELSENGDCDLHDWILPEESHEWFLVKFVNEQFGARGENKVRRIVVIDGCVSIDTYKPMILELEYDLKFDKGHGAVCLPKKYDDALHAQHFTVYGLGPKGDMLTSAEFSKKQCDKENDQNFVFCGKPINESRGLCAGDFGGGAVTKSNGRNVLLGIYAEGNVRCENSPQFHQEPEFIDIQNYTRAICIQTGICPNDVEEFSTTTEGVYVPGMETKEPEQTFEPETTTESSETLSTSTLESIVAETFERMQLNNCSVNESKEIHIHIHLDKDAKFVNN
ncbi:hypothetical protein CAEBREN_00647 [Caenorhabditis brenneri]|uniref:Peptidase S1 domain-containing protein n=1 Tax=Caenorhabditis brenneri TaxID=135651 RepID=G0MTE9_CAEBE|nr:hypothetical protein CAEBREN_00647 [Caenorhabditis brenneri]